MLGIIIVILGQIVSLPFYVVGFKNLNSIKRAKGTVISVIYLELEECDLVKIKSFEGHLIEIKMNKGSQIGLVYDLIITKEGEVKLDEGRFPFFGIPILITCATVPFLYLV